MRKSVCGFAASILVALATASASAGYLYCMIEDAHNDNGDPIAFDFATISIDDGHSYLHFISTTGEDTGNKMAAEESSTEGYYSSAGAEEGMPYYAYIDKAESDYTTFLFQLWSKENDVVGWQTYNKSDLAVNIFNNTSQTGESAFVLSQVIPEPTSGILLLLGMAGLALRRKMA